MVIARREREREKESLSIFFILLFVQIFFTLDDIHHGDRRITMETTFVFLTHMTSIDGRRERHKFLFFNIFGRNSIVLNKILCKQIC